MTRVSENSSINSINHAVGKTKSRLEDLQLKGSTLKRMSKPSDDPIGNVDLLAIRSRNIDADQYLRNLNFAQSQLSFTENVVAELTDILMKAKELAVGQASSIYTEDIRAGVAKEVRQLREQAIHIANKRIGNRYLFSGQKILTRPFDKTGNYQGDSQKINIEINKDVYVPINVLGKDLFFTGKKEAPKSMALDPGPNLNPEVQDESYRGPASGEQQANQNVIRSVFDDLQSLETALVTNNHEVVQGLLERFDEAIENSVSIRTDIGALTNTISNAESNIEKSKLTNETYKSKIEDADIAELFSDLQKDQAVLKASYKASSHLMNTNLMDFLR